MALCEGCEWKWAHLVTQASVLRSENSILVHKRGYEFKNRFPRKLVPWIIVNEEMDILIGQEPVTSPVQEAALVSYLSLLPLLFFSSRVSPFFLLYLNILSSFPFRLFFLLFLFPYETAHVILHSVLHICFSLFLPPPPPHSMCWSKGVLN